MVLFVMCLKVKSRDGTLGDCMGDDVIFEWQSIMGELMRIVLAF